MRLLQRNGGLTMTAPSVKTMIERLCIDQLIAEKIRIIMTVKIHSALVNTGLLQPKNAGRGISGKLDEINDLIGGNGVELIGTAEDDQHGFYGLEYVNMGDTYRPTILYNHKTGNWTCGDWGSIVERNMKFYC